MTGLTKQRAEKKQQIESSTPLFETSNETWFLKEEPESTFKRTATKSS